MPLKSFFAKAVPMTDSCTQKGFAPIHDAKPFLLERMCSPNLCREPAINRNDRPIHIARSSEAKKHTTLAISSGTAGRLRGPFCSGLFNSIPFVILVMTPPGHIALILIPFGPYSTAAVFVKPTTPCLLAAYPPSIHAGRPPNPSASSRGQLEPGR